MLPYLLKLILLVPLVAALAWGSLWLWKRAQAGLVPGGDAARRLRLIETLPLGPQTRLLLVECDGHPFVIGHSRAGLIALRSDPDGQ